MLTWLGAVDPSPGPPDGPASLSRPCLAVAETRNFSGRHTGRSWDAATPAPGTSLRGIQTRHLSHARGTMGRGLGAASGAGDPELI